MQGHKADAAGFKINDNPPQDVTVLIGSTRPAKVEGAREALAAIARVNGDFADFTLHAYDLTSIAPRQPLSLGATIDGARMRATALLDTPVSEAVRGATAAPARSSTRAVPALGTFCVGVEGGLAELPGGEWSLQSWAAVTDGHRWGYGAGPSIVLPASIAVRVLGGEELGNVIDEVAAAGVRGTRGAWGILTLDLIGRREAFRLAVIAAFAPFYNANAWSSAGADVSRLDSRSD